MLRPPGGHQNWGGGFYSWVETPAPDTRALTTPPRNRDPSDLADCDERVDPGKLFRGLSAVP